MKNYKVITPLFPTYAQVKAMMKAVSGYSLKAVRNMITAIHEQTGTPQKPVDWSEPDLWISELKALVFGFLSGVVAAYRGLNPPPGPKGVGDAVNQSVVITFLLLFAVNFILTTVYLQLVPPKGM